MSESETGYVYVLIDPRTEEPKYVGASTDPDQRLKAHTSHPHSDDLDDWISGLEEAGETPEIETVVERPVDELGGAEEAVLAGLSTSHELLNGREASGYHYTNPSNSATEDSGKGAGRDVEEGDTDDIEELREQRDEYWEIAYENSLRVSNARDKLEKARNAVEWVDKSLLDEAHDELADALGVEDA